MSEKYRVYPLNFEDFLNPPQYDTWEMFKEYEPPKHLSIEQEKFIDETICGTAEYSLDEYSNKIERLFSEIRSVFFNEVRVRPFKIFLASKNIPFTNEQLKFLYTLASNQIFPVPFYTDKILFYIAKHSKIPPILITGHMCHYYAFPKELKKFDVDDEAFTSGQHRCTGTILTDVDYIVAEA